MEEVLISDLFHERVIEWVKSRILHEDKDENSPTYGEIVLPLENLQFLHCSVNEFNQTLLLLSKGGLDNKKYPFIWINNGNGNVISEFDREGQIISVKQMLIGTLTSPTYLSDVRTEKVFKPILIPIKDKVMFRLSNNGGYSALIDEEYKTENHYFYGKDGDSNPFNDSIDIIEVKDFKLRIYKLCNT